MVIIIHDKEPTNHYKRNQIIRSQTSGSLPVASPTRSCPLIISFRLFNFIMMIAAEADRLMKLNGRTDTGGAGRFGLLPTLTDKHKGYIAKIIETI